MSRAWFVLQELFQATVLVAPADPPDGGPIALQAMGEIAHTLASGNGQDDPGVLHLEPSQAATVGDELQDRRIHGRYGQRTRFSATHEDGSDKGLSST
jgi:hypothetical protein